MSSLMSDLLSAVDVGLAVGLAVGFKFKGIWMYPLRLEGDHDRYVTDSAVSAQNHHYPMCYKGDGMGGHIRYVTFMRL